MVAGWFAERFREPTDAQRQSWPRIVAGEHTLVAAPTGSGKTLAAFLASIDSLLRQAVDQTLPDETQVVYVSPLKALSNDIHRNLQVPLEEIHERGRGGGSRAAADSRRRAHGRHAAARAAGDAAQGAAHSGDDARVALLAAHRREEPRDAAQRSHGDCRRNPRAGPRQARLASVAVARAARSTCAARRRRASASRPRSGRSTKLPGFSSARTTSTPMASRAATSSTRATSASWILAVEVPPSELSAVCSVETWQEIYARLSELIREHRSTLVFVNTRRLAERVCHYLEEQLGEGHVASHHGSLSRETRLRAEEQLKNGQLKAIVATASLELGIDIGYIDLVCQIGSPRSIATFLQRVGRAGHALGRVPKGRLFALTRDELLESMALVRAVRRGQARSHRDAGRAARYSGAANRGDGRLRRLGGRRTVRDVPRGLAVSRTCARAISTRSSRC